MLWKRTSLAALPAVIAVPAAFFLSKALLTRWYLIADSRDDGQTGLSIIFGSVIVSLLVGLITIGTTILIARRSR